MKMNKEMKNMKNKIKKNLVNLPTPSNITYSWNLGSMLATMMSIQIMSGFLMSTHFIPHPLMAFQNYTMNSKNPWLGFSIKFIHSTSVTMIFSMILIHMFRSMLNNSLKNKKMWNSGTIIMIMLMATAFMGYVLPWGQMSMWGATVICNLMSSIPILGSEMVKWMWGNFSVSEPTLNRFMSIHFMLPMMMIPMMMIHMMILHIKGSSNNMNINPNKDKIKFSKKFSFKDLTPIWMVIMMMMVISKSNPMMFMDNENFNPSNPLMTPIHIMPEWYFLFAYAMLRSIPNKMGGVVILMMSIMILFVMTKIKKSNSSKFNPNKKMKNMTKMMTFFILTFLGSKKIEEPFNLMSMLMTIMYFPIMLM